MNVSPTEPAKGACFQLAAFRMHTDGLSPVLMPFIPARADSNLCLSEFGGIQRSRQSTAPAASTDSALLPLARAVIQASRERWKTAPVQE